MLRLRHPVLAALALVAACGGKVLVDNNGGGGDQGGGPGGSTAVPTGAGGTNVSSAGAFSAGGSYVAGSSVSNPAGGYAGTVSTAGAFGIGGTTGTAGAAVVDCGDYGACISRSPALARCSNQAACLCKSCTCEANSCLKLPGCQQIWSCALKYNCHGIDCYTPQTCKAVIDQYGVNSISMNLVLGLDKCVSGLPCDAACGAPPPVDAGAACMVPPPPVGSRSCTYDMGDVLHCSEQCFDQGMNSHIAKCVMGACTCYFNSTRTCECFDPTHPSGPGTCGTCCPAWK